MAVIFYLRFHRASREIYGSQLAVLEDVSTLVQALPPEAAPLISAAPWTNSPTSFRPDRALVPASLLEPPTATQAGSPAQHTKQRPLAGPGH